MKAGRENHWHSLDILLQNCPAVAESVLKTPCPVLPPENTVFIRLSHHAFYRGLEFQLQKHVLSCLALPGWQESEVVCGNLALLMKKYGRNISAELLHSVSWTCVPILVCRGVNISTCWLLLGYHADQQELEVDFLLPPIPAPDSVKAIRAALQAVCTLHPGIRGGFFCCSLQGELDETVCGASLGLVFGLAMSVLIDGGSWPETCYATGELSPQGTILPVNHVREKFAAVGYQCRVFLHPDEALLRNPEEKTVSCRTLADGIFIFKLAGDGISGRQLELFKACAHDGHVLLTHFNQLPATFFSLPEGKDRLREIALHPAIFLQRLADSLAIAAAHNNPAGSILAALLAPDDIVQCIKDHPDLDFHAFKWCISSISLANHRGNIQGARRWRQLAEKLLERLSEEDVMIYLNHSFVGERFNCYDFRPELPPDMTALLEIEERRQAVSPRNNRDLGALYGTIAQNFGFCGPRCLPNLRRYVDLAIAAFGRKYRTENLRPQAYLIYGLLDACRFKEAAERLNSYLGLPAYSGPADVLSKLADLLHADPDAYSYQAALTCRALAEISGGPSPDQNCLSFIDGTTRQRNFHPWQLTALNLGRLYRVLGEREAGERILRHALDVCLSGETTMRIMALLPLAELHHMGVTGDPDYLRAQEIEQLLLDCPELNRTHFQTIFRKTQTMDPPGMLTAVYTAKNTLFPFSYR
ncbi:MAG: hypothetical protein SCH71_16005 [Desulfobulbaceae bacterium]|nr:hypothetical protein [Desulfobulbaceae bacterium]